VRYMLGSPEGDSFKKKLIPAQETKSDEDLIIVFSNNIWGFFIFKLNIFH